MKHHALNKIFGIAGWSGSGKTTLITQLINIFVSQNISVSTLKHAHHRFDIDHPGKDSHTHRTAGATEVLVASHHRWALMHELREAEEPGLDKLLAKLSPVDLILIEGWKHHSYPKIEVIDPVKETQMLWPDDPNIIAVASDHPIPGLDRPHFNRNDSIAIADFILKTVDLLPNTNTGTSHL